MNDIAECLYSGALYEKIPGSLITTFNSTKNYFSRATVLEGDNESEGVIDLLKKLRKQISKLNKGKAIIKLYSDITRKSVNPNDINDTRIINKLLLNSELNNAIQQFTKTDNTKEILRNIYTMISGESSVDDIILLVKELSFL